MKFSIYIFFCTIMVSYGQRYRLTDPILKEAVSYATISFGNGNGMFADAKGFFNFSPDRYKDIDTLYITAVGYKDKIVATRTMPPIMIMEQDVAQLQEVYLTGERKRKYKVKKIASKVHSDYFKCWLPTVESEIGVYFSKPSNVPVKIASVSLPVKMEASRSSSGKVQSFSTLFKMQFYSSVNGAPGPRLMYEDIIFRITEKDKANFELDISKYNVYVPAEGIFVSIQVLGYTDSKGNLQDTRKYHEVETPKGFVKISTTFRPLLPFTEKIDGYRTYTRRIFYKNRTWQRFDTEYTKGNSLIQRGLTNYGMGVRFHIFEKQ
ncbi:hypothetical protein ACE939_05865 [Aquimarina sp. W85]|uniref:hypothetical protein n=1 Tax=Aquimarina rhodophyticola TaxID=3342246 RepID=UPI0036703293